MLFNCVLSQVDAQARAQQAQRIEAETRADQAQAAAASKALEEGRVLPQPTEEPRKIQSWFRFDRRGTEPFEQFERFEPFEFFQNRNFL